MHYKIKHLVWTPLSVVWL